MLEGTFGTQHPLKPGDSFGMDLDSENFESWRARLPQRGTDPTAQQDAHQDLQETFASEFASDPAALIQGTVMSFQESTLIRSFLAGNLDSLQRMISESLPVQIQSSPYYASHERFSEPLPGGGIRPVVIRTIANWNMFTVLPGDGEPPCWYLPDIIGHSQAVEPPDEDSEQSFAPRAVLEPEIFTTGPFHFIHCLRTSSKDPGRPYEELSPRFSTAAFQEAVEHFVGLHAGVPELQGRHSYVNEVVNEELKRQGIGPEMSISSLRLVEGRLQSEAFHFTLELQSEDGPDRIVDLCVFLTVTGEIRSGKVGNAE